MPRVAPRPIGRPLGAHSPRGAARGLPLSVQTGRPPRPPQAPAPDDLRARRSTTPQTSASPWRSRRQARPLRCRWCSSHVSATTPSRNTSAPPTARACRAAAGLAGPDGAHEVQGEGPVRSRGLSRPFAPRSRSGRRQAPVRDRPARRGPLYAARTSECRSSRPTSARPALTRARRATGPSAELPRRRGRTSCRAPVDRYRGHLAVDPEGVDVDVARRRCIEPVPGACKRARSFRGALRRSSPRGPCQGGPAPTNPQRRAHREHGRPVCADHCHPRAHRAPAPQ